jgi:hypothetical protein
MQNPIRTLGMKVMGTLQPENRTDYWMLLCPLCQNDGKKKYVYIYKNTGKIICYRCVSLDRKLPDSLFSFLRWYAKGKIFPQSHKWVWTNQKTTVSVDVTPPNLTKDLPNEALEFLKTKRIDPKGKEIYWDHEKKTLAFPLYPRGFQYRYIDRTPKYQTFSNGAKHPIYIPNSFQKNSDTLWLVEGVFDALSIPKEKGDAIALLGTSLSPHVLTYARRMNYDQIILFLDPDIPLKKIKNLALKIFEFLFTDVAYVESDKEPNEVENWDKIQINSLIDDEYFFIEEEEE